MSDDERAALVDHLRKSHDGEDCQYQAAALIEADGKRLALAEKTIAEVRTWKLARQTGASGSYASLTRVLNGYEPAKETGL